MTAVLQFEIDTKRFTETKTFNATNFGETPWQRLYAIAKTAACDTLENGGTFVLVVTAEKITMVQRSEAEQLL